MLQYVVLSRPLYKSLINIFKMDEWSTIHLRSSCWIKGKVFWKRINISQRDFSHLEIQTLFLTEAFKESIKHQCNLFTIIKLIKSMNVCQKAT